MALNVTTAVCAENCNTATASPSLAQWDTEQVLQISGIDLPDSYKVEFSTVYTRNAIPAIGDASGVAIPNVLLQRSAPITAYVVLYGENGGRNREYWITIYITPGQPPETITPDPEQADVIDQAIAALNNGVARTEAAATSAEGSARDAEAAAEAVQNLSVAAETLATGEPATVEKAVDPETGAVTLNFGLPRGVKGDPLTYEDLTPEQKAELVQGPILEAQDAAVTAVGNARASAVNAVESAGTTQVNAVNQAGTTQTGAVNQAGANQVAAVNQAGATQVQAVEDKGDEVLDSIPPDYTDLVDDVANLSRQLSDVEAFIDWSVRTGYMVRASDGRYVASSSYNSYEYPVYCLSKVFLTSYFTNATYGYAFYDKSKNFISNSGGTYEVATRTEITVPDGAYYIRFTENTSASKPKLEADWGLLLETKADIEDTKTNSAEVYANVYDSTDYIPTDGLSVVGKYYDANGSLQTASNMSTTGIIDVPYGIKDIYYNAYRNTTVPTILFFDSNMQIVGTVIATVVPVYGDTSYFGYAEIPSTAKFMEFSMNNTMTGQIVTVRYSKVDNNLERIKILETDPLYGKKITCTGDSITSAIHSVPYNGYVAQIANAHGMTIDNQAIWGAVFPQNKTSGGEPRGCIYDTIALMDASADIVVISGGINDAEYYASDSYWGSVTGDYDDALDTETFCGALEAICKEALQKWSGKPIIFVFEHRMTLDNTTYGAHFNDVQYPLMIEILQKWGIPYVDLYHDMPSLSYNEGYKAAYTTGNGVHPNYDGYAKFYVPRVYSKIKEVMGI